MSRILWFTVYMQHIKGNRQGCPLSHIVPTVHFKKSSLLQLLSQPVRFPAVNEKLFRHMPAKRKKIIRTFFNYCFFSLLTETYF